MDDANKVVKTEGGATAPVQAVDANAGAAAAKTPRELELEAKLAAAESLARKEAEEKENYKQGLLRAKGKKSAKPLDLSDPITAEEQIKELVEDKILEDKAEKSAAAERDELEALRLRVQEQDRLIKSGLSAPNSAVSSGSGSAPVNDPKPREAGQYWTEAQRQALRDRGHSDAVIAIMEDRARRGDITSEQKNFVGTRQS